MHRAQHANSVNPAPKNESKLFLCGKFSSKISLQHANSVSPAPKTENTHFLCGKLRSRVQLQYVGSANVLQDFQLLTIMPIQPLASSSWKVSTFTPPKVYVWVNSRSIILTRKNDGWKYILKCIFFNTEYLVMVHLTL